MSTDDEWARALERAHEDRAWFAARKEQHEPPESAADLLE